MAAKKSNNADAIYFGGKIYTMESESTAEALATKGDTIFFVGSKKDALKLRGGRTKLIDLKGKTMLPGFIEPHMHHAFAATSFYGKLIRADEDWGIKGIKAKPVLAHDNYLRELKKAEKELKDPNEWLLVSGYAKYFHGEINKTHLEGISKTRPIILLDRSGHVAILNGRALAALNFTEESTKGNPDIIFAEGKFVEAAAIEKIFPSVVTLALAGERWRDGLIKEVEFMHSRGVTTCADMMGYDGFLPGHGGVFREIVDSQDVPMRTYMVCEPRLAYEKGGADAAIKYMESLPAKSGKNLIYGKQAKLFVDGAFFSQLMLFKDGYTDGHEGAWITPPQELKELISLCWKNGYSMHIHVQADAGIDFLLPIFEGLQKESPMQSNKVTLHHLGYARPDQIKKMKELNIMASLLPYYHRALADIYSKYGLGEQRATHISPAGDYAREKVIFSLHSDFPMAPANPLFNAWCAVNRVGVLSGKVLAPEERISVHQALRAITIDAAKTISCDDITGSIKAGKKADFAILKQDPYATDPRKLKDVKVHATVFNGRLFKVGN